MAKMITEDINKTPRCLRPVQLEAVMFELHCFQLRPITRRVYASLRLWYWYELRCCLQAIEQQSPLSKYVRVNWGKGVYDNIIDSIQLTVRSQKKKEKQIIKKLITIIQLKVKIIWKIENGEKIKKHVLFWCMLWKKLHQIK